MKEISELRWLEPPPEKALDYAKQVLRSLNAVEEELTAHGRAMARLPLHPRLAHLVLMARPQDRSRNPRICLGQDEMKKAFRCF